MHTTHRSGAGGQVRVPAKGRTKTPKSPHVSRWKQAGRELHDRSSCATSAEAGDDYGHVVGLLGRAGPLLDRGKQAVGEALRRDIAETQNFVGQTRGAELLAINVLGLEQTVTESDKEGAGFGGKGDLLVSDVVEKAHDRASVVEFLDGVAVNEERRAVARVCVAERTQGGIVFGVKKRGVTIVGGIQKKMAIQRADHFGGGAMTIEERLAAKRRLQAGHQKRGRNSLSADVRNGQAQARGAETHEIIVITRNDARRAADSGQFEAGHFRESAGKKLGLDFARDGQFVFKLLALALLFDQLRDGAGHGVERFREHSQLIALAHVNAMAEIALADVPRGFVKIVNGNGDGAREHDACRQRGDFENQKKYADENQNNDERVAQQAEGSEETTRHHRRPQGERGADRHRLCRRLIVTEQRGIQRGTAGDFHVVPAALRLEGPDADDLASAHEPAAVQVQNVSNRIRSNRGTKRSELDWAKIGSDGAEQRLADGHANVKFAFVRSRLARHHSFDPQISRGLRESCESGHGTRI